MPSSRRSSGAALVCGCWLACLLVSRAHAHPVPALSPDFGSTECITVVDKRATTAMPLDYFIGFDDVLEEPDHIPVPDQKTHQFFALRGQLTGQDPTYHYWPFDPALPPQVQMPVWIDQADLLACAAKNSPTIAPDFSPEKIGADTLRERPELANQWLDIRQMRTPITERQALLGLQWPLADVPAGVYQVAGYIYSPPYNAWEARPGVIKVIDGVRDVPAVTLNSIDAMLFEGQGRKIGGCIDAASGSELRAYYRTTQAPNAPWEMWESQPVDDTGKFELCFRSPRPGFAGIVEVQVVAISPEGEQTAAYAPDQLVLIPSAAPSCTPSAKLCCDAPTAAGAAAPSVDAAAAPAPTGTLTQAASAPTQPAPEASSGCTVSADNRLTSSDVWCGLAVLLTAAGARRRRTRASRTT